MAPSSYIASNRPTSLQNLLDTSTSKNGTPSLDLRWEPFQQHVENFLTAIDAYTQSARTEIVARATDHYATVRDKKAEMEETEKRIQLEREKEGDMLTTLESERHVLADLNSSLSHLQNSLTKTKEQSSSLEAELQALRKEVRSEETEKERQKNMLNDMRDRDTVELKQMEEALGWKVEGIKGTFLLMRFYLIDPDDPAKEFSFIVDVSKQDYTVVPNCDPPIPTLPQLVRQLNEDRDLFSFIKKVRKSFRALIPNPPNPSTKFDDLSGPGLGLRTPGRSQRTLSSTTPAAARDVTEGLALDHLTLGKLWEA
ncbi:hypothetical protein L198_08008 [Cryptococcus wingfieldii CBS 7118]|uniref:Kinetochore protein SPC25 n=1 Tax=Cryptococcus wingfieldii CBS 7118 TaxID=1295528 RepID=A0A1E3HP05_9TREE|nr:hypothetical protein L198_08008 [Cryptococcus wingfieldii CBS 7118]ODN78089.1 hypothetical protein L198_08008 [Cryptococcus wingfieldii CBS 7118]